MSPMEGSRLDFRIEAEYMPILLKLSQDCHVDGFVRYGSVIGRCIESAMLQDFQIA